MLSAWVMSVPPVAYSSVRKPGVPPRYCATVAALSLAESILPVRVRNSASVMSLVQQRAVARLILAPLSGSNPAATNGVEHFAASGVARMFVVVCRSHWEWRHTRALSLVKVTSHSRIPAPMRAAAS